MNTHEAGAFRPGAQLAAQLLTLTLRFPERDPLEYMRDVINEQANHQDAIGVLMLALQNAVEAHARLVREHPPAGGIEAYLVAEGAQLAGTLRFLDEPIDPGDDDEA